MRKTETFIMLILFCLLPIFSMSVEGSELDNPFPSLENLARFDFSDDGGDRDLSDWQINLVSTRTGGPVYAWFGHTSLEVVDPRGDSMFFDYGYFTFSEGFYKDFALGLLYYNMYGSWGEWRMQSFINEDRTVWRTPLPLSNGEKQGIIDFLKYNEMPENNTYLYHYFNDNCATRVRDIINAATHDEFRIWAESIDTGLTLRTSASMYLDKIPPVSLAINYLLGPTTDDPISLWDAMYLPEVLQRACEMYFGVGSEMIVESSGRVDHRTMPLAASSLIMGLSFAVLMTCAYIFDRKRLYRFFEVLSGLLWILMGAASSILLFMMIWTNHDVTYFNENLLYVSPLAFIMGFEALHGKTMKKRNAVAVLHGGAALAVIIVKLIVPGLFYQYNIPLLLFILPLYVSEIARKVIGERKAQSRPSV